MKKFSIHNILILLFISMIFSSCNKDPHIVDIHDPIDSIDDQIKNFVWKNWYLSVPINRGDGNASSIFYETIENDELTEDQKVFFYKNSDDTSYTFYTKFTGYTTSGEAGLNEGLYCRTELREFWKGNQTTSDNWSMNSGTHILRSTIKVEYCGGEGLTFVAQIHGISSPTTGTTGSPATVKVLWSNGELKIEYYTKPVSGEWTSDDIEKISIGVVDNEIFTIKLRVQNGILAYGLSCPAKGIETDYTDLYDYDSNGYTYENYFKTGNYFKWDSDYTESSQVILYELITEHN